MNPPIPGLGAASAAARPHRATSSSTANTGATASTRSAFTRAGVAAAAPLEGKRTLDDAQLEEMGAEIIRLYREKVVDHGGRRLAVKSPDGDWSIRGFDLENLVIHTKDGLIQLRPDGMPTRNAAVPIRSWHAVEAGLKRALETLRAVDVPRKPATGIAPA